MEKTSGFNFLHRLSVCPTIVSLPVRCKLRLRSSKFVENSTFFSVPTAPSLLLRRRNSSVNSLKARLNRQTIVVQCPNKFTARASPLAEKVSQAPELDGPRDALHVHVDAWTDVQADIGGAVLQVEDLTLSAGGKDLIGGGSWRLMPGDHAGLVGVNGCGKSTLLRAILRLGEIESGSIILASGTEVAYLEQTAVSGSTRTVWEEAGSRMLALNSAIQELNEAEEAVEKGWEGAIMRLANAHEQVQALDGYRIDEIIAGVLDGLGFQKSDWSKSCAEFSGGWQMRIALARLLLGQRGHVGRSLLVLDEPTNHLDANAKEWLGQYVKNVRAAVVIVSHDQDFLEKVCNKIVEIRGGQLHHFVGGYSAFLRARAARQEQAMQAYISKQSEISRLEGFVTRFGAKASKASEANSRKKQIQRIKDTLPDSVPDSGLGDTAGDKRTVSIRLPKPPPCAKEVLKLKKANIGWAGCTPLLQNVDIRLELGMRLVILGPNGCGKSTLMLAMSGRVCLLDGIRNVGEGVEIGVFTQDLAQDLPSHMSGMDFVLEIAREKDPSITAGQARTALGALGLSGDAALRPIRALSGGEKARVALGVFVLRPYNCLLLDEASNHLDHVSAMALAHSLSKFQGTMVAISHDEEFCKALAPTHVARVHHDGSVIVSQCAFGDFQMSAKNLKPGLQDNSYVASKKVVNAESNSKISSREQSSTYKDQKRLQQVQLKIENCVKLIEKADMACKMVDKEMVDAGCDTAKVLELFKKKQAVQEKLQQFEKEWEQLEEELLTFKANVH